MGKSYLRVPLDRLRQDALHGVSAEICGRGSSNVG